MSPPTNKSWKLIWYDEFVGTSLDEIKWEVLDQPRRDGNWSPEAVSLDGDGHLVISTIRSGEKYLTGCVRTLNRFEHTFGFYEARIQLHSQPGHWPAFWLMGRGITAGVDGRAGTEVDIIEKPTLNDKIRHALHWGGYGAGCQLAKKRLIKPGIMCGFHTFAVHWSPSKYVFYVDGIKTWHTRAGGVCQVPLYIKLSDEVGTWAGDIGKADLPDQFLVDYVRVYEER